MTRQLILLLTAATIVFWLAAVGIGASVMRSEFDEVFDSALKETSARLLPLLVEDLFRRAPGGLPRRIGFAGAEGDEYLTYQLRDPSGKVLLHSHSAEPVPFDVPLKQGYADTATHRVYTETAVSGSLFLQVADPLEHRREAVAESVGSLFVPLALLIPLSVAAIWLLVRRTLSPIEELRSQIGARDGTNLAPLRTTEMPPELGSIAHSVDHLLERLRAALDSEREFAANSAHELRTPIAGALAQTQRLLHELPEGPARRRAREVEKALSGLSHLAEKLLQMARADSGIGLSEKPVDLVPVVAMIVKDFQRGRTAATRLRVDLGEKPLMRRVDVDAFGIALRNLVENALKHGASNEPVIVSVRQPGIISVANAGPPVPPAELAILMKRFRRGQTSASGSGLGLAIAATLVDRMGGRLDLLSPALEATDGFEARISLPVADEALA